MSFRLGVYCLIVIIASMTGIVNSTAATCEGMDKRCPCLRYTYKMVTYNNKCFQLYYGSKTWQEAKDYCVQQGGRLVMLNDPNTYQFIKTTLNSLSWKAEEIWIGAHDLVKELRWVWTNKRGEPDLALTWSRWAPEHPEGWFHDYKDCVVMKKDNGQWKWHEAMCHTFPFEYRFICEYDMSTLVTDYPANPNEVGGVVQNSRAPLSTQPSTIPPSTGTNGEHISIIRHGTSHGETPRGDHRKVTGMDDNVNIAVKYDVNQQTKVSESTESKDGHVPMYAVVLAFVCGTLFALAIVIFILIRRRKRKRKANDGPYPAVEYHARPGHDVAVSGGLIAAAGAVGGVPVCGTTGKLCKIAVDMGAEACACAATTEVGSHRRVPKKLATPNVYVSVGEDGKPQEYHGAEGISASRRPARSASESRLALTRLESPADSSITSSITNLDEAPPTYDEACADIIQEHISTTVGDSAYANEDPPTTSENHQTSSTGAIPKTPKKAPAAVYLPMNGSANNSPRTSARNSQGSNTSITHEVEDEEKDTSQYIPMSLGELPPIPTDHGYEIPVSRRPKPEAVRQARPQTSRPDSVTSEQGAVYSEIPDRASRSLYQDDEQIYSTID